MTRACPRLPSLLLTSLFAAALAVATATPLLAEESQSAAAAGPDIIVLTDGRQVTGEIVGEDDDLVSVRSDGVLRAYPKKRVTSITRGERPQPAPQSASTSQDTGASKSGDGDGSMEMGGDDSAKSSNGSRRSQPDVPPLSAVGAAWLTDLVARARVPGSLDDKHVRGSLASALAALGPAAAPALREAVEDSDGVARQFFTKVLGGIERKARDAAAKRGKTTDGKTDRGGRLLDRITRELGLTAEQRDPVAGALAAFYRTQREIMRRARKDGLTQEQTQEAVFAAQDVARERLSDVLTDDQLVQFGELVKKLRKKDAPKKRKKKDSDAAQ